ncbi:MAG TPA: hypothetical protein DEO40_02140 [Treponema sp.]|jgi:hypothetical protein|nr:hypothetical protein [Treponema sp.]HCA19461.1 hypothetical protein [Treponema sp.]
METQGDYKMKHSAKIIIAAIALSLTAILTSCYEPSPLYGTWADNKGNKIMFDSEGGFSATVIINGNKELTLGTYIVLKNILVLTSDSGNVTNTEWDIRGNIMYLNWVDSASNAKQLQLYKIAN